MLPNVLADVKLRLGHHPERHEIASLAREISPWISDVDLVELVAQILNEYGGLGPLNELVRIPGVTDVVVNGHEDVWIDRGYGMERVASPWTSESELYAFAVRLSVDCERRLDELNPFVDARLDSGIRIHIISQPLSTSGTQISLRIAPHVPPRLHDLVKDQDPLVGELLKYIINRRMSFLICGGTGSGKTTLLAAMLSEVSEQQRIVIVEDSAELVVDHGHCVKLQSRLSNAEGIGEITMRVLVRQALRMRPDRIVVGEVRGAEILELFSALNTGHRGCGATIHANSAHDVISRVQLLGITNGLSDDAAQRQLATAIDVVIELEREGPRRLVREIGCLVQRSEKCEYIPLVTLYPRVIRHGDFATFFGVGVEAT